MSKTECVKVAVRCRPLVKKEIENKNKIIIEMNHKKGEVHCTQTKHNNEPHKTFTFDMVFDWTNK